MDEIFSGNLAELCGSIAAPVRFSHESRGIRFYTFPLETLRLSGAADTVNILLRESMLPLLQGVRLWQYSAKLLTENRF